jgi:hypothetical protein
MRDEDRCRSGRHVIRDPHDRVSNGACRRCAYENQAAYRHSCRDARRRLRAIEAALAASV